MAAKFRVGLTGGIGSGKSLVADELARLGAHMVDADRIAHEITAPGGCAIGAIAARFGRNFIDASGGLDRAAMRELAFREPDAKAALEAILHPEIRAAALSRADAAPPDAPYVLFVIPLLIESGSWRSRADRILVIDCPPQLQVERVIKRNGLAEATVRAIIASQAPRAARLDAADDVLVNDGSVDDALRGAARLHALYLRLAAGHAAAAAAL